MMPKLMTWLLLCALLLPARTVRAEDIVVSNYGSGSPPFPWSIAVEKKYFQAEGVDITGIISSEGGGTTVRNMVAGGVIWSGRHQFSSGVDHAQWVMAAGGRPGRVPTLEQDHARLVAIQGTLPDPARRPAGCRYAPRCGHAVPACTSAIPLLETFDPGHTAACIRVAEFT
jgi:oligopeptide/dipeptide ABC transporter ATP-binding protein